MAVLRKGDLAVQCEAVWVAAGEDYPYRRVVAASHVWLRLSNAQWQALRVQMAETEALDALGLLEED